MKPQTTNHTERASWKPMLEARLYRNIRAESRWNDARTILTLEVPTKRPGYMVPPISWIVHMPETRKLQLDAVGGQLWEWCDGQRSVEKIIELFAQKHNLTFHESRVSVTTYLKELLKRGTLAVAV